LPFQFLDRAGLGEIDETLWPATQMRVRVDKAGHQYFATEIDRIRGSVALEQFLAADGDDVRSVYCDCRGDGQIGIDRNHFAVVQNRINRNAVVLNRFAAGEQEQAQK
jgi:hypothetical protein